MGYCVKPCSCTCMSKLIKLTGELQECLCSVNGNFDSVICELQSLNGTMCGVQDQLRNVYASLASVNPMAVAAEYPLQEDAKVVYTTDKVRFLDMLNPKMIVLFKGILGTSLPVYFQDTSNYQHIVAIGDTSHQALSSELVNNYPYPALYVGNYIVLNPTEQTMEDFKNGLL